MMDSRRKLIDSVNSSNFLNITKSDMELSKINTRQEQIDLKRKQSSVKEENQEILPYQSVPVSNFKETNKENESLKQEPKSSSLNSSSDSSDNHFYTEKYSYINSFNPLKKKSKNKNDSLVNSVNLKENTLAELHIFLENYYIKTENKANVQEEGNEDQEQKYLSVQTSIIENKVFPFRVDDKNEFYLEYTNFIKKLYFEKIILEFLDK